MANLDNITFELTQDRLREVLHYDPDTGIFTRLVSGRGRGKIGSIVGSNDGRGYLQVMIDNKHYKLHRLAYLYQTGEWPKDGIDHRSGERSDNRWENLRNATLAENNQNKAFQKNNTSGFTGVSFAKATGKWMASIKLNYKKRNLGYFDTPEEASAKYLEAKAELHIFQRTPRDINQAANRFVQNVTKVQPNTNVTAQNQSIFTQQA